MHVLLIPSESYLVEWSPLGGVFQADLALGLRSIGADVGVLGVGKRPSDWIFRRSQFPRTELSDGIRVRRLYARLPIPQRMDRRFLLGRVYAALARRELTRYMAEWGRPDILHAHNVRYGGVVAHELSCSHGIPYVVTEHSSEYGSGMFGPSERPVLGRILRAAAARSAVSPALADLVAAVAGIGRDEIDVIPNMLGDGFLDPAIRSPDDRRERTVLCVADLIPIKGHRRLLAAFASAFKGEPVRLRLVGQGSLEGELRMDAARLGVFDQVDFVGRLPRQGVLREMRSAACLVLASDRETFGVVVIEAMSQGLPVVTTASGGPEWIVGPEDGLIVRGAAPEALAGALREVLSTAAFDRAGIARRAQALYSPQAVARRYLEWYAHARSVRGQRR